MNTKTLIIIICSILVLMLALYNGPGSATIQAVLLLAGGFLIYFIPSMVASGKPQNDSVFVLNLFLGWTFLGWVVALAWAVNGSKISNT